MNANATDNRVKIQISAKRLAEISAKSPGYVVDIFNDAGTEAHPATGIRFRVRAFGRRDMAYVEMTLQGRPALFASDTILRIAD